MMQLVFWQPIPSFHQEGFLETLASSSWVSSVTLMVEHELPEYRRREGWRDARFHGVTQKLIGSDTVPEDTPDTVHIFTGLQTHPGVWNAYHRMISAQYARRYAYAEAPELVGLAGWLRRWKYRYHAMRLNNGLDGMLAIGNLGVDFYRAVLRKGLPVYSFGYYDVSLSLFPDLATADEQKRASREFEFLYVGQLIRRKGVDRLLKSLALLKQGTWTLRIAGDGSERQHLEKIACDLGIRDRLNFVGVLTREALDEVYRQADCLVLPSRWDGWGITVNEGLRYGCRVLASSCCGASSVLPPEQVLPKDIEQWPTVLDAALSLGTMDIRERQEQQKLALALSAEAGAERLRKILCGEAERA